jgi:AmmeMemoRadiSam system protein B
VSETLPRLRGDLDFMPSPVEDRPGLLIRDSRRYSDSILIIPPALLQCLACFDGEQTQLDLRALLVEISGDLQVGAVEDQLIGALRDSGFLEEETFFRMREAREKAFAEAPVRAAAHAGSAYPEDPAELRQAMDEWIGKPAASARANGLLGIAAPHVSPQGGYESYRAAYRLLGPPPQAVGDDAADRTFVILGTSHYGAADKFGLTRKPYLTPWGASETNTGLVEELSRLAPAAIGTEDYCHAVEHSIEFQILFLQSLFGPKVRTLPILCGSFARSIYFGGKPEDNEDVRRFFGVLGDIAARESNRLVWVLGIDMAHMGRRYGDSFEAIAEQDGMLEVAARDRQRMDRVAAGDAGGFWELVQQNRDDLKWCGSAPLYTFLKTLPQARGTVERYEQWNIDPQSVVSFAGMSFRAG